MRLTWPLTGRTGQMRTIASSLAAPETAGVVISGAAGVGKSRLAREALAAAESAGTECRWVVAASSARGIPLGAFAAWTPRGVTDSGQLVRGVIDAITAMSAGARLVVGVDAAHLLDELSLFVVHQLVLRSTAMVILTVRSDAPIPVALAEILQIGRFVRLDVTPLSAQETAALLSAVLAGAIDPDAAARLWQLSGGNMLYLRNIVEREVADGRLSPEGGIWRWSGDPVLPPDLIGLVESRIGALPDSLGDVVDVLAVAEPMELGTLLRIADPAAVEAAEARSLITVDPTGAKVLVRVAHPLYGEVRRRSVPQTRLRRLRGRVATELARTEDSEDIQAVVRRAALSIDSDLPADVDLLLKAAHGAVWLADLQLADRLARVAVDAGAGPEAKLVQAHALSWLGHGEVAEAVLANIPSQYLSDTVRARLAFLRASNMLWALGKPERAKDIIEAASDVSSRQARGYVDAFRTVYWFAMDRPEAAMAASKTLTLEELPPIVGAEVAWVLTTVAAESGHMGEALSVASAGNEIAQRSLDAPHMRFNIADSHVSALLLAGRIADALEVAHRVSEQAAGLPGAAQMLGTAVAGRADLAAGRLDSAASMLGQAVTALSTAHASGWGYRYRVPYVMALAMRGDTAEAAAALAVLDERPRDFRPLDYELAVARAWVAAGQGAVSEAISLSLAAARRACERGQFAAEVLCLQTATQFGERGCAERLAELAPMVEGPRAGLAARFATALHAGDAAELVAASEEFDRMGDLVAAVDAAAHAALAYRNADRRGSALGCSARAAELAARCGGAVTPALRHASEPLPLTEREREIAMLLGQGLSNREVAQRLTVSIRTVESHIYRAMAKTGTASREELAALMTGTGRTKVQ